MRAILLITIIIICTSCTNRSTESKYYPSLANKEWALEVHGKYWSLPDLTITEKKVLIDSLGKSYPNNGRGPSYYIHTLIFKPDGKIEFSEEVKNLGLCGNGLMKINTGSWQLNKDRLIIDIEGSYALESNFHYKIEYLVSFPKDSEMILKKKKNILWSEEKLY